MSRAFLILIFSLAVLGTLAAAALFLAYGVSVAPPAVVRTSGLDDSVMVTTFGNGSADINARSRSDAFSALGFLHAQEHAWTMALWRRTASGRLSRWFGDEFIQLDQLSRRLGLDQTARTAYAALAEQERSILEAYARGVNAALALDQTRLADEFVALDTQPERWEPWHSLSIERLFAWLSAERPSADSLSAMSAEVRAFFAADRQLREWLHLHGFQHSMAWTVTDSAATRLVQRQVYGASALPIFNEVRLRWNGNAQRSGASLIGTPFFVSGATDSRAWCVFFSSSAELTRGMRDTTQAAPVFDRIETADGRERLLRVRRSTDEIFFPFPPSERVDTTAFEASADPDTTSYAASADADTTSSMRPGWVLRWSGFGPVTDAEAWSALADGDAADFRLLDGDGLVLLRNGSSRVMGDPLVSHAFQGGSAIGNSEWTLFAARRLDSLARETGLTTTEMLDDRESPWAAHLTPPLTEAAIAVPEQPHLVSEALTFLRNWDFAYDRASIAASVLDTWMTVYRDSLGQLPEAHVPDTALGQILVRYETLVKAVEELVDAYGDDPSQWRWEEVQTQRYYFPVWSADSLLSNVSRPLSRTRYAPIELPGAGHPSTILYGPSPLETGPPAPARWVAWISTADWGAYSYRTRRFPANRFFGRYLVSDRTPDPAVIADADRAKYTVTLIPE